MAHAQKKDFIFLRNGRVHLNRRGPQLSRLLATEVCASVVVMLDKPCSEVVWRVLATHSIHQFPLHFPPVRHRVPSHFNWTLHVLSSWWRVVYHLLSAVHDCLSNIFASIIHIWRPSLIHSQFVDKPWRQGNHYVCTCPVTDTFDTPLL